MFAYYGQAYIYIKNKLLASAFFSCTCINCQGIIFLFHKTSYFLLTVNWCMILELLCYEHNSCIVDNIIIDLEIILNNRCI